MTAQQELFGPAGNRMELAPGAFHLPGFLTVSEQRAVIDRVRAIAGGPARPFVPTVRGGGRMHLEMLCLGRHWNALTYAYEPTRADFDRLPAPELPDDLRQLAERIARACGFDASFDACIVNFYGEDGRLGVHQDKGESPASLAAGVPVVSLSLGDTARFLFGGLRRKDPLEPIRLRSGDAFVFGGPARLRYHGVSRVLPGTAPPTLEMTGRINLTFRQY